MSACRGEKYVINHSMHLCNPRFSWREIAQKWRGQRRRIQKLVYLRNFFPSILSIRICDRSAQFLVNCSEKNSYGNKQKRIQNSTYLLISEERLERERRERQRTRINRRAGEEDSSGKFMQHLRLVY